MQLPNPLRPGDSLSAWSTQVVNYLRAVTMRPSALLFPRVAAGGTTCELRLPRGGAAAASTYPFELLDASTTVGETTSKKFRVRLGFLAGLLPAEMVPGDDPQCIFDYEDEMMDVWGAVDVDEFNNFTAASITAEAHSETSKPNTATTVYILIGHVWFDGNTFRKSQNVTSGVYPLCMYSVGSDVLGASWTKV